MPDLTHLIRPLYERCFTVDRANPDFARAAGIMGELLADGFQSINAAETKGKQQLIQQVQFFWKLIPDLSWAPQEMLQDGSRVVVRSIASGSPKGEFMGLTLDGTRSFRIMTIDIHTLTGTQVSQVHHLEEWTTAIRQLKA